MVLYCKGVIRVFFKNIRKEAKKINSDVKTEMLNEIQPQTISKESYLESVKNMNKDEVVCEVIKEATEDEAEVVRLTINPKKIICPDCGGITLDGLECCHLCGGEIEQ